ncbi:MAG: hypothetical protein EA344_05185 [Alkalicoccus sp.]|jgi:hypothetical protein|nr:MAG: hypothetical protein EA344_05185 [Alkalicoccus sp.]
MKKLLFMAVFALTAAGCSSAAVETESYEASEYTTALPNQSGEDVEVFTEDRADLYYYFTGVN